MANKYFLEVGLFPSLPPLMTSVRSYKGINHREYLT